MCLCKFGQNPFSGSEDNALKRSRVDMDADWIHTKNNLPIRPLIGGITSFVVLTTSEFRMSVGVLSWVIVLSCNSWVLSSFAIILLRKNELIALL